MASSEKIGSVFVEVEPELSSNFGSKISSSAGAFGGKFGGAFMVAAGNIMADVFQQTVKVAVDTFVEGFNNYANFEQLAGGVEKIFDQADQSRIFEDAANAYKDLNLSANQYLEAINQVGAAFSATMGDKKGYEVAREGMKAISDYASGTGRNLDELNSKYALITRATASYQSIADQFSGILPATSKAFLEQAQAAGYLSEEYTKLTDVPIEEYQEAVTKMLTQGVEQLGLAGNTAKETASTISGSLAGLSASWSNFLTALFDKNADIGPYLDALGESIEAAFTNIGAVVDVAVQKLFGLLVQFLTDVSNSIGQVIGDFLVGIARDAEATINQMGQSLSEIWGNLTNMIGNAASNISNAVVNTWSNMLRSLSDIWGNLTSIVSSTFDNIRNTVANVFGNILATASNVWENVKLAITNPIEAAKEFVHNAIEAIKGFFNFNWSLPDLKLPHIVVGDYIDVPVLGRIPNPATLRVDWYAQGGFVDGATLIGAGENGAEMILPSQGTLMDEFAETINSKDDDRLIAWLEYNLGPTINEYTPTLSRRDFDRLARAAI